MQELDEYLCEPNVQMSINARGRRLVKMADDMGLII